MLAIDQRATNNVAARARGYEQIPKGAPSTLDSCVIEVAADVTPSLRLAGSRRRDDDVQCPIDL